MSKTLCPTCGHDRETFQGEEGTGGFVPPQKYDPHKFCEAYHYCVCNPKRSLKTEKEGNVTDIEKLAKEVVIELFDYNDETFDHTIWKASKVVADALRAERLAVLESPEITEMTNVLRKAFTCALLMVKEKERTNYTDETSKCLLAFSVLKERLKKELNDGERK
jgi:hypothetical protein